MALTCNDIRLTPPDAARLLLTLAPSLAPSYRGLRASTWSYSRRGPRGGSVRGLQSGHLYCSGHKDFGGADEPSQLDGADHEGAVMGVVLQVEGGGQCPSQITGTPRLRLVTACPEADLFQQVDGVAVVVSARPFAQQPGAQGVTFRDRGQDSVTGRHPDAALLADPVVTSPGPQVILVRSGRCCLPGDSVSESLLRRLLQGG
jgi:hypothetical protein